MSRLEDVVPLARHYADLFGARGWVLMADRLARRGLPAAVYRPLARVLWAQAELHPRNGRPDVAGTPSVQPLAGADPRWFAARFPDAAGRLAAAADQICAHVFDVLGTGPRAWGHPIEWHVDPRSGHRWPVKFYPEYGRDLTPGHGADVKVPWELSRLHHLVTLAQAWRASGEPRYAAECIAQWQGWEEANPWLYGVNWVCAMEAAIRAVSLLWVRAAFDDHPAVRRALDGALRRHGRFIEHNLEVGARDGRTVVGNHYLFNLCGLAALGLCCPEFPEAGRWRQVGLRGVEGEIRRQVLSDGVHFEASTGYHRLAAECLLVAAVLALRVGHQMSAAFWDRLERMLEVVRHLTRPDGCVPQIGDADDGRLLILDGYPDWPRHDHRHLLALGAVLLRRGDFKAAALRRAARADGGALPEVFWLLGREGVEAFEGLVPDPTPPGSRAFPHGGLYVIRGREGRDYLLARTAPAVPADGHAHADALSVELWAEGRPVVVDPGTYGYTSDPAARAAFRSLAAHNTVLVDIQERAVDATTGPFQPLRPARVRALEWRVHNDGVTLVGERYPDNVRDRGGVHRRSIRFAARTRTWLIEDTVSVSGEHTAELRWHLPPGTRPEVHVWRDGLTVVVGPTALGMLMTGARRWQHRVEPGWVSPSYGMRQAAPIISVAAEYRDRCTLQTSAGSATQAEALATSTGGR